MAESGKQRRRGARRSDIAVGGYQQVALELMAALSGGPGRTMILNVRNGSSVPGLPPDAVVEVPCVVGAHGVTHWPPPALPAPCSACYSRSRPSSRTPSRRPSPARHLALRAFAQHPLVDSVTVAKELLASYRARQPMLAAILR